MRPCQDNESGREMTVKRWKLVVVVVGTVLWCVVSVASGSAPDRVEESIPGTQISDTAWAMQKAWENGLGGTDGSLAGMAEYRDGVCRNWQEDAVWMEAWLVDALRNDIGLQADTYEIGRFMDHKCGNAA